MLQLKAKNIDICRIGKLLVKYNIKASITNSEITLDGDVSDELLTKLCESIDIEAIQNFISQEPLCVATETSFTRSETSLKTQVVEDLENPSTTVAEDIFKPTVMEALENLESTVMESPENLESTVMEEVKKYETTESKSSLLQSHNSPEYDLIYSEVKRGEVYLCDFGKPYGSEQGYLRYAIVFQNDDGNSHSPTTIVVSCTTEDKKQLPVHFRCTFSSKNMIDYDLARVDSKENVIMAEQIRTVAKTRLRKYIGTLTPEFMKLIEEKIYISLNLSQEVKTIEKKVYIDRPVYQETIVNSEAPKERKDVNMVQVQLLSFVDINELFKISQSNSSDDIKAQRILELFGFDFKRNGVTYLLKAIITSPKNSYFNLETLSESVSRSEGIDKEEVKRLIVARVKETFGFKKAPTIDFIRLVNIFLVKQEV